MMELAPPIPSPPGNYWRRWRNRLAQAAVFLLAAFGIALTWGKLSRPLTFFGQVEVIQAGVASPDAGLLTNLWVTPFQEVKVGDLVAEVTTTDPRTANNRLEVMRDRMRLTELEMNPMLKRESSAISYAGLIFACEKMRADLAAARVNLRQVSNQFERVSALFHDGKVVSDLIYDKAKAEYESIQTDVEEKSKIVAATQKTLERLAYMANETSPGSANDPLKQALAVEEDKIKVFQEKLKPLQLLAPLSGVVTVVHHQAGEQIAPGQPLVLITSKASPRIIGFLPQNFPLVPQLGMKVEVRTRTLKRRIGLAKVIGIGPHWEAVTNTLVQPAMVRPVVIPPMGRPISISLPEELKLLPGEPVDLRLRED